MEHERLKKYLANELSPEERNAFEQEMENDPFLQDAVEGLEAWQKDKQQWSADALETKLQEQAHRIHTPPRGKMVLLNFVKLALAASIIGIISLLTWRTLGNKTSVDTQELFAAYYQPMTHPDATVRGDHSKNEEDSAIQAYEKENYFEAVNHYRKLTQNHPKNVRYQLFLGISYLSTQQAKKAIETLQPIITSAEYQDDIHWYLAMAYLKNKEVTNALVHFNHLTQTDNYYQQQAKEIADKLDGKLAAN